MPWGSGLWLKRRTHPLGIIVAASSSSLAHLALRGTNQLLNASTALAAEALEDCLPVAMQAVRQGLMTVEIPARFQVLPGKPAVVLDVAHNPQAAAVLAENLASMGFYRETWRYACSQTRTSLAVHLLPRVDHWLLCDLCLSPAGQRAGRHVAASGLHGRDLLLRHS